MGGKEKQRTKGNLKPSSSGSAAALISKDGTVGFVGFGGLPGSGTSNLGYVPMAASVSDDADSSVDAEFRMVMRKLMKRDAVTKFKAMQEFTHLCKNATLVAVESALPFWPRLFNKLALDVDYRVREATQQAMEQLVLRVGRNLAPHLRYVIGPWLCAQFDTYAVVASAAKKAFQAAFSEEKQSEAILYCRKELLEFLQDNILNQTPSTLSDPKFVAEDDREARYIRVLSSSILALGNLISVTSNQTIGDMEERYLNILKQNKFWKSAKHKSPHVRGAIFCTVYIACEHLPALMSSLGSLVSPAVLYALDDSEPAVCQHLWNAVLSLLKNITDCWKHVSVRKAVLPKLWSVLKNGGSGSATSIFPNLLPFLSKLPPEVIDGGTGFYQEFFSNMQDGLTKESVQNSPSECSAMITAYMECLRFCLLNGPDSKEPDFMVQEYLIKHQLLPVMKTSLTRKSKLKHSNLYFLVADLLSYLSKWSDIEIKEQRTQQQFTCVHKSFWEGFTEVCMEVIMASDNKGNHTEEFNAVSYCLISLMCPSRKKKQLHKVAFAALPLTPSNHDPSVNKPDTEQEEENSLVFIQHPSPSGINVETVYDGYLLDLVCHICIFCLEEIAQRSSLTHLKLVAGLVPHFLSVKLLTTLLKMSKEQSKQSYSLCEDSYSLLSKHFIKDVVFLWMKPCYGKGDHCELGGTNVVFDSRSVEYVIDIFCGIIKTLSEEKQLELISQSFQQDESVNFMYKLLEKGLDLEITGFTAWLHSSEANERLLELSHALVLHGGHGRRNVTPLKEIDREIVWKILKMYIVTKRAVIKPKREFLDKIFQNFLTILRQTGQSSEQELLLLLDILQSFLEACEDHPQDIVPCTNDLLLNVFELQWCEAWPQTSAVPDTLSTTWKTGLKLLSHLPKEIESSPSLALLLKASEALQEKLMKIETLDRVDELASVAMTLVKDANLFSSVETEEVSLSQTVFLSFIPSQEELAFHRRDYFKTAWLFTLLQHNKQPVITDVCDSFNEWSVTGCSLTKHQKVVVFVALLVKQMIAEFSKAGALKSETLRRDCCIYLWLEISWLRHWCSCVMGCEDNQEDLPEYFKETNSTVYELVLMLKESGGHLMEHIKQSNWCESLLTEAFTRSRTEGLLWSLVLGGVLDDYQKSGVPFELAIMLADVQSLAPTEEKESQTLSAMISRLDSIYELKVITEQYLTLLHEDNDERAFACVLSILGHCLHKWFQQIKHDEEAALLEYQLTMTGVLDELLEWKKTHSNFLLMNTSLDNASMSVFTLNSALIGIMNMALQHCSNLMSSKHWDFILCSVAGWLQMCEENKFLLVKSLKCATLCCQACSLFCTMAQFFDDNASKLSKDPEDPTSVEDCNSSQNTLSCEIGGYPPNLFSEWQEFFSGTLFGVVLNLFLFHAEQSRKTYVKRSLWVNRVSESLGCAVVHTPTSLIKEHNFEAPAHGSTRGTSNLPQWIEDLMEYCLPLLMSDLHGLQFTAFHLLSKVMTEITFPDNEETEAEKEEEELIRSPPVPLMKLIDSTSLHMTEMINEAGVPFGEYLDMSSDSEAQNVSLALMLAWKLLLKFFRSMPQETRVVYAKYIKQHKLVHSLLAVLFRLIPLKKIGVVIAEESMPVIGRFCGQRTVQEMACSVYYWLSQWMPAIVRQWWNGLDKHQSSIVDRFTTSCITPQLCQREMHLVQNSSIRFHNMQVKTRPSAREVAAVYTVDEISMELVVKLAANHPLGVVSVESGKKIGVTAAQWRSWMLQMTTFLTHQNGCIMDGLILWKRNVDKRFEGVEDCMICFSVIHGSNYSLPKLSCKTCKKKFHSACLYKWFSTSNNATCPLCRNLF